MIQSKVLILHSCLCMPLSLGNSPGDSRRPKHPSCWDYTFLWCDYVLNFFIAVNCKALGEDCFFPKKEIKINFLMAMCSGDRSFPNMMDLSTDSKIGFRASTLPQRLFAPNMA